MRKLYGDQFVGIAWHYFEMVTRCTLPTIAYLDLAMVLLRRL